MQEIDLKGNLSKTATALILIFVFYSGFANLATEIIGPRLVASLFGSTTVIWAIIISVTLLGISLGYFFGGRVRLEWIKTVMPAILIVNAFWLLGLSWWIWRFPEGLLQLGYVSILVITGAAFLAPAMLFSMASPLSITLLSENRPTAWITRMVGTVLAIGTAGSILGALAAAFLLIPYIGLTASLRIFALINSLFALYFARRPFKSIAALTLVASMVIPQPSFEWESASGWKLVEQREGHYQTIRVYTDDVTFIRMHLGPSYESEVDLKTGEPNFKYARTMLGQVVDPVGAKVLIIGGAGHAQAHYLEKRGALVTEVEIDPFVSSTSDEYFGPIEGQVVIQDGRAFIDHSQDGTYDYIFMDAFSGPDSVPPQLTTTEFFESTLRALNPNGRLIYNFIGVPTGPRSGSFQALSATISSVYPHVSASWIDLERIQNIIFVASRQERLDAEFREVPSDGVILTDDLNPIEMLLQDARGDEIYYRR